MVKAAGRRWRVNGRVQGVGYRYFVQHKATTLGLVGWARNREDGSVEVQAFGPQERLDDLGAALYIGPRLADVRSVNSEDLREEQPPAGFSIR